MYFLKNRVNFLKSKEKLKIFIKTNKKFFVIQEKELKQLSNKKLQSLLLGNSIGYCMQLKLVGVGYRFEISGSNLFIKIGYSHLLTFPIREDVEIKIIKKTRLSLKSSNFFRLKSFAMMLKSFVVEDKYKGKGLFFINEPVRVKEGKKK